MSFISQMDDIIEKQPLILLLFRHIMLINTITLRAQYWASPLILFAKPLGSFAEAYIHCHRYISYLFTPPAARPVIRGLSALAVLHTVVSRLLIMVCRATISIFYFADSGQIVTFSYMSFTVFSQPPPLLAASRFAWFLVAAELMLLLDTSLITFLERYFTHECDKFIFATALGNIVT